LIGVSAGQTGFRAFECRTGGTDLVLFVDAPGSYVIASTTAASELRWITSADDEPAAPAREPAEAAARNDSSPVQRVLSMLRDVNGVVGSIAVANAGDVLGSDLPRVFDGAAIEALAMRLSQLRAALASADRPMTFATLRYHGHSLFVSQLDGGILGVLAESKTHEPALDMVARLVGQRLEAAITRG
jgi:hypothetical protein